MDLGARLKAERERLGYSQTDFAALAGASKHAQINWEKGVAAPNATVLSAWATHGLDVLYVVTGERSYRQTSAGLNDSGAYDQRMTSQSNAPSTAHLAAETPGAYKLNRREQALIENYRGSDELGRRAVEGTASALAHRDSAKEKRQGGE